MLFKKTSRSSLQNTVLMKIIVLKIQMPRSSEKIATLWYSCLKSTLKKYFFGGNLEEENQLFVCLSKMTKHC